MFNGSGMNHRLQGLTLKVLRNLCINHNILIEDGDLKIILRIMQDNPCSVLDEDFRPILFIQIENKTSRSICEQFRPMIEKEYMMREIK